MRSHVHITIKQLQHEPLATATIGQFKDNTNPEYVGPGSWDIIHKRALKARAPDKQKEYIEFINDICVNFNCMSCRGHCSEYIKNNPLEEYCDTIIEIDGEKLRLGMFIWAWKFHNAVNKRLGKPIMSWDTAYNLYAAKKSLLCSESCMNSAK